MIEFFVPGPPQGKARARTFTTMTGRVRSCTPPKTAAYEANFSEACWKKYKSGEGYIPGLAERSAVRNLWMNHTRQAINKLGTDEALSTPTTAPEE